LLLRTFLFSAALFTVVSNLAAISVFGVLFPNVRLYDFSHSILLYCNAFAEHIAD